MLQGDLYLYIFNIIPIKATCFTTLNKPILLHIAGNTNDSQHCDPLARIPTFRFNPLNLYQAQ
jgi:hypothetical protein